MINSLSWQRANDEVNINKPTLGVFYDCVINTEYCVVISKGKFGWKTTKDDAPCLTPDFLIVGTWGGVKFGRKDPVINRLT